MTLESEYLRRCLTKSDINDHLPLLRELASVCDSVVELGTRSGNSTVAFLAAQPKKLRCIDLNFKLLDVDHLRPLVAKKTRWSLVTGNTLKFNPADIPECDLLFIDTLHTYSQITHELTFAPRVKRHIAIHDVVLFGDRGEHREPGITKAILEFLESTEGRNWRVSHFATNNNGVAMLERTP